MTSKWNLVTGLDVFVLVTVKTLTTRSRRGESRAIWRTHWRPVLCVSLRLMGGFSDEGRIDSRLMIGNGDSASERKKLEAITTWTISYFLVDEIFCPVDWSTKRSCKSSNSPPFFVVLGVVTSCVFDVAIK